MHCQVNSTLLSGRGAQPMAVCGHGKEYWRPWTRILIEMHWWPCIENYYEIFILDLDNNKICNKSQ